jgi:hypothetical protein
MTTRDILDHQGNVIGSLDLPDDTPEDVWAEKLEPYARVPPSPSEIAARALDFTIQARKAYCEDLIGRFKRQNISGGINAMQGLWMHHRLRAMPITFMGLPITLDFLNLVISGDVELGCIGLQYVVPDAMNQPYHWLSEERLTFLINDMKNFLGWPITALTFPS